MVICAEKDEDQELGCGRVLCRALGAAAIYASISSLLCKAWGMAVS